jgi:regulator of protease activity HflC (stomatin/prohibitin superfamily)
MERNGQRGAVTNFLLLLVAGVASYAIARQTQTLAGQVASFLVGFGVLVSLVSWFQIRLEEQERLEQMEFDEVTRNSGGQSLFDTGAAEAFPARRSRETFERWFVPIFTALLALGQGATAYFSWQWLKQPTLPQLTSPLLAMGLFGGLFLVLFLIGQFSTGVARLEGRRLLRPSGNLMLLAAYLCAITAGVLGAVVAEFARADLFAARAFCLLLGLLSFEGCVAVVLELYRPRVKGKAAHPLYDSRLIGLLSHPEGVFTTAASALDYQFGFKVSDTWFYQFLRRSFGWLVLGQFGLALFSSCFVFVNPGEQALLERFGRPVEGREILGPGLHMTLPWPVDQVRRYRTEQIQSFIVGGVPYEANREELAFLWTINHFKEEFNLLTPSQALAPDASGRNIPLSFLTVSIPVHYQISDLKAFAYRYENSGEVLEQVANEEVVRFFAQTDVSALLSKGQGTAAEQLRQRIQDRIDREFQLGVKILFLGLQDIHPPVRVAADYEQVVSARQRSETNRLEALAFASSTNVMAETEARRIIAEEGARSTNQLVETMARASRFTNLITAYTASPVVYRHRMFLQAYTNGMAGSRKIILVSTNKDLVIQYDAQQRVSSEIARQLAAPRK